MRYRNHDPLEMIQIILQNRQRADIQVVGRLVEQKDVWRAHQDMEQIESAPLAARQLADQRVLHMGREQEPFQHLGCRYQPVRRPHVLCHIFNVVDHAHRLIHIFVFL